jgi:hypothetical protein
MQEPQARIRFGVGIALAGAVFFGHLPIAAADSAPKAELMVVHATKCAEKKVDPAIGDAPPSLGYECMKLLEKKSFALAQNQPGTTLLPNGRTFQLAYNGRAENRYKVTASISPPDGGAGFVKLADITAEPNKTFNVGGFAYQGGVLVLAVRIVP